MALGDKSRRVVDSGSKDCSWAWLAREKKSVGIVD
jgi:hypothetical protein